MKKLLLIAALMLVLVACAPAKVEAEEPDGFELVWRSGVSIVHRIHDDEHGVTCWVYTSYNQGGISCLRD